MQKLITNKQINNDNILDNNENIGFFEYLFKNIKKNEYFSAGVGILSVGALVTIVNRLNTIFYQTIKKNIFTSLEITVNDHAYYWILEYIVKKGIISRHLSLKTKVLNDETKNNVLFSFLPSIGKHLLLYDKKIIFVERNRDKNIISNNQYIPFENIKLTSFIWSKNIFKKILKDAKIYIDKKEEGKTLIYKSFGSEWRPFGSPKKKRPIHSVILPEHLLNYIINDIQKFLISSSWYINKGIPYRRCYLLYGPPGCGKSSLISSLAGYFDFNLCTINVNDIYLTDDRFIHLLATIPPKTILILEDIDYIFINNKYNEDERNFNNMKTLGISYSGLLNALDGIVATEERIIFMTTNNIDKLPNTLIRPGRVDMKILIPYANNYQYKKMFLRFFPDKIELADQFCKIFENFNLSMAEIQSFFLFSKEDPYKTIQNAQEWVNIYNKKNIKNKENKINQINQ